MAASKSKKHLNFLAKFRNADTREFIDLTASQFLEIWRHYDTDNNGYIEGKELDEFLREFISSVVPNADPNSQVSASRLTVHVCTLTVLKNGCLPAVPTGCFRRDAQRDEEGFHGRFRYRHGQSHQHQRGTFS